VDYLQIARGGESREHFSSPGNQYGSSKAHITKQYSLKFKHSFKLVLTGNNSPTTTPWTIEVDDLISDAFMLLIFHIRVYYLTTYSDCQ